MKKLSKSIVVLCILGFISFLLFCLLQTIGLGYLVGCGIVIFIIIGFVKVLGNVIDGWV